MPEAQLSSRHGLWPEILAAVKTPLGFFALVVLVVEGILGGVAAAASGSDRTFLIRAMVCIIVLLVGIVAYFAYSRPEALAGKSGAKQIDRASISALQGNIRRLESEEVQWTDKCQKLEAENTQLTTKVNFLINLKSQIRTSVAGHRSATLDMILSDLNLVGNVEGRAKVQSLITILMDENLIEPDNVSGFFRTKTKQ